MFKTGTVATSDYYNENSKAVFIFNLSCAHNVL